MEMLGEVRTMLGRRSEGVLAYDEALVVAGAAWGRASVEVVEGKLKDALEGTTEAATRRV